MKRLALLSALLITLTVLSCHAVHATEDSELTPQFAATADSIVPFSVLLTRNPADGISFLKDVMQFTDKDIENVTQGAINFFNVRYGLDFSHSEPNENFQRVLPEFGATFQPFQTNPLFGFKITPIQSQAGAINDSDKPLSFENRDGGFGVTFNSTQTLFGTYGGASGISVSAQDTLVYGFFNVPIHQGSNPLIIQYQSSTPIRTIAADGFRGTNSELFSHELGQGVAQGLVHVVPVPDQPGYARITIRYLLLFHKQYEHEQSCSSVATKIASTLTGIIVCFLAVLQVVDLA